MTKFISLNINSNILISSTLLNYNRPDFVYFPISQNKTILVKQNSYVKIDMPIMKSYDKEIVSSVSGIVRSIKKANTLHGIMDAIKIENDFQDERLVSNVYKRNIKKIAKEEINQLFYNQNIFLENKKNLILNCIDDEPYVANENFYLFYYMDDFLQILDQMMQYYHFEKIIIAVKSENSGNINQLMNQLGMYPNITLMMLPNLYLLGKEQFLLEHLYLNDEDSIVIAASSFSKICDLLLYRKNKNSVYLTISGDGIEQSFVVNARIGTKLKDVMKEFITVKENVVYIVNGLMTGREIDLEDFIVTEDVTSLLIMKKREEVKSEKCIHCGACIDICPFHLDPSLFKNKNDTTKNKCIKCGLCSYICPVYINFNKEIEGDLND